MKSTPRINSLVLDTGPILSLMPLRGLAEQYFTVPQVLDELRDTRAREHFQQFALTAGVPVEIRRPDATALAKVTTVAKKTGDYAALSQADLCVLALTYALDQEAKAKRKLQNVVNESVSSCSNTPDNPDAVDNLSATPIGIASELNPAEENDIEAPSSPPESSSESDNEPDTSDSDSVEDDGEGEWITPSNVALHKSRALNLLPAGEAQSATQASSGGGFDEPESLATGCMTADFAMQNVLLHMGLNLVDIEGKRIDQLKTWVLRCHACFKICKNPSKKFCPSCGNPTLLRASVTVSSSTDSPNAEPKLRVHLKKNFQWRLRGTKYSIPSPKPGSSKGGTGEGLILREDQTEWIRAEKRAEGRRLKEEMKMLKAAGASSETGGVKLDWMDPDWRPEMLVVSAGGKGRSHGRDDMPTIGYGRKNPNVGKRRKK